MTDTSITAASSTTSEAATAPSTSSTSGAAAKSGRVQLKQAVVGRPLDVQMAMLTPGAPPREAAGPLAHAETDGAERKDAAETQ